MGSGQRSARTLLHPYTVPGSLRLDWLLTLASTVFGIGVVLDSRGHLQGTVDSTLLSPRHAPLYGGVLLVGLVLAIVYGRTNGVPRGHALSALGVLLFFTAGVADLVWHAIFGVEIGLETLLSPTHILLALAGGLILSGPLRAAQARLVLGSAPGWKRLAPALISASYLLGLITILTAYAHPLVGTYAIAAPPSVTRPLSLMEPLGVASILLQSGIQMGLLLLLARSWHLPVGSIALLVVASGLPVIALSDTYGFVPGILGSALLAEGLYRWLTPSVAEALRWYAFGFSVPTLFYAVYFVSLGIGFGIGWSSHLVAGSVLSAGVVGLLLAYLTVPVRCVPTENLQTSDT